MGGGRETWAQRGRAGEPRAMTAQRWRPRCAVHDPRDTTDCCQHQKWGETGGFFPRASGGSLALPHAGVPPGAQDGESLRSHYCKPPPLWCLVTGVRGNKYSQNLRFGWGGPGPFHFPQNLGSESHTTGFTDTLGCHYSERDLTGSIVELCGPRTLAPLVKTVGPFGQVCPYSGCRY